MNYFKTIGGALILVAVIGLEALFSVGVWYMIAVGFVPALGDIGAQVLGGLVAPTIGIMALVLFIYSHRLKQLILEWEAENGDSYNEDHKVYYNKHSHTNILTVMKVVVLLMDSAGIFFRVLQENIPWYGQALLVIVFELLAISPWYIGTLVHIVSHRPAYAIRRDVEYMRNVVEAQKERQELLDSLKHSDKRPATAPRREIAPAQKQQSLPEPRYVIAPQSQTDVQVSSPRIAPKGPNTEQLAAFTVAPSDQPSGNGASQNGHR